MIVDRVSAIHYSFFAASFLGHGIPVCSISLLPVMAGSCRTFIS